MSKEQLNLHVGGVYSDGKESYREILEIEKDVVRYRILKGRNKGNNDSCLPSTFKRWMKDHVSQDLAEVLICEFERFFSF